MTYPEILETSPLGSANHCHRFFNDKIKVYSSRKYTNLNFGAFMAKQIAMEIVTNDLCQCELTLVVMSNATRDQRFGNTTIKQEQRDVCDEHERTFVRGHLKRALFVRSFVRLK